MEADETTAALARANLAPWPRAHVEKAHLEEAADRLPAASPTAAWWFDLARRLPGVADITGRTKRTFSLDALSPSWSLGQDLATDSPSAGPSSPPGWHITTSRPAPRPSSSPNNGDVVEAGVWWGAAVRDAGRSATILSAPATGVPLMSRTCSTLSRIRVTPADAAGVDDASVTRVTVGDHLYEADKALTRSSLVGALLNAVDGQEFVSGFRLRE